MWHTSVILFVSTSDTSFWGSLTHCAARTAGYCVYQPNEISVYRSQHRPNVHGSTSDFLKRQPGEGATHRDQKYHRKRRSSTEQMIAIADPPAILTSRWDALLHFRIGSRCTSD
ncbi:hypothetical protein EVAR_37041_1 [Eumeta japonica]|uniref:Uncharacterized protein n=1 Tax=Eumeta variegata TaxID=151549 RepID=A0A4C1WEV5_EUMVA|nr:hypothetical protein EVAR_37041_1 [Eumeta japonica]